MRAHLKSAVTSGATLLFETSVASWKSQAHGGVEVTLTGGERYEAGSLVICAGAWLSQVATDMDLPLRVERNVMHWFAPASQPELFTPDHLPIYILDRDQRFMLYGFPDVDQAGLKAAFHHSLIYTTPEELDRSVTAQEVESLREALAQWLPEGAGRHLGSVVCMYTLTPDLHFVIGRHPHDRNVIVAGGFSGHGFKFCSVMGEVLADLVTDGATKHPIDLFSPQRFRASARIER